jgi:hypothetical protein
MVEESGKCRQSKTAWILFLLIFGERPNFPRPKKKLVGRLAFLVKSILFYNCGHHQFDKHTIDFNNWNR